jgi:methionyl-tRNA formyltransferase
MRIVFFGTPEFAVSTLQRLIDHPAMEVVGVVSQPDRPQGRGHKCLSTPIKALAQTAQLPIWQPERLRKADDTLEALAALKADIFVVVAYGQILSTQVLAIPRLGCVNVHGSLLPAYRGAAPIQWAIARGESETGVTTMLMDAGMDTGDILLTSRVPILPDQTAGELAKVLAPLGAACLIETLDNWETLTPTPQDSALATYAPLLTEKDFQLNWERSALELHNHIRGFHPECFTGLEIGNRLDRIKVLRSSVIPTLGSGIPGEIREIRKGKGMVVQTGSGEGLLLTEVQLPGKKVQAAWDVVNGLHLRVGQVFQNLKQHHTP